MAPFPPISFGSRKPINSGAALPPDQTPRLPVCTIMHTQAVAIHPISWFVSFFFFFFTSNPEPPLDLSQTNRAAAARPPRLRPHPRSGACRPSSSRWTSRREATWSGNARLLRRWVDAKGGGGRGRKGGVRGYLRLSLCLPDPNIQPASHPSQLHDHKQPTLNGHRHHHHNTPALRVREGQGALGGDRVDPLSSPPRFQVVAQVPARAALQRPQRGPRRRRPSHSPGLNLTM
jgi:hypothetical protein